MSQKSDTNDESVKSEFSTTVESFSLIHSIHMKRPLGVRVVENLGHIIFGFCSKQFTSMQALNKRYYRLFVP